jgi:hypothetical protein
VTPTQIADHLEKIIPFDGKPQRLKTLIERELILSFGICEIKAAETAERVAPCVGVLISKREGEGEHHGILYPLTIVGSSSDIVAGSCYVFPIDLPSVAQAKLHRVQVGRLYEAIKKLTFSQFEHFGARVLHELGAKKWRVTPHAGDQGIDFYGEITVGHLQNAPKGFFQLAHDVGITVVGQAKHYPTRSIGPNVVRELVGALSMARTKTFSRTGLTLFDDVSMKPFSPLLAMLLTTGEITTGALQLSNAAGIVTRTGLQLAVFLADKGVGIQQVGGLSAFDEQAFSDWLTG